MKKEKKVVNRHFNILIHSILTIATSLLLGSCDPFKTSLKESDVFYYSVENPIDIPPTDTISEPMAMWRAKMLLFLKIANKTSYR